MPARIALVGAPGTGKTTLSLDLASRLRTRGHRVVVLASGQPSQDGQRSQGAGPEADLLIEDGPEAQSVGRCALILLMGLDLKAPATSAASGSTRETIDAKLRDALTRAGTGWRVIYGQGPERVQQALQAISAVMPWAWSETAREEDIGRWSRLRASCEKCGDADCEHRLFTGGALRAIAPPT